MNTHPIPFTFRVPRKDLEARLNTSFILNLGWTFSYFVNIGVIRLLPRKSESLPEEVEIHCGECLTREAYNMTCWERGFQKPSCPRCEFNYRVREFVPDDVEN